MKNAAFDRTDEVAIFPDLRLIRKTICEVSDGEYQPVEDSEIRARLCHIFRLDPVDDAAFIDDGVEEVFLLLWFHEELTKTFASEHEGKLLVASCHGLQIADCHGHRSWRVWTDIESLKRLGLLEWTVKELRAFARLLFAEAEALEE